ncbi:MAG: M20 family metallopeptidase [Chloroflexi bacterium]|nr:M20 family metallopeptidase [Chloroflexota bacterium]
MTADARAAAQRIIEGARDSLIELSHALHADPEIAFQEVRASASVADQLDAAGFTVTRGLGGLPTAVSGVFGSGPLHVAIVAEYDALPGVGHACGHNIICAAAMGAALGLAAVAGELGLKVSLIGTPAEEGGGGKITLLEEGAFAGVHAAMMVHPAPLDTLDPLILAAQTLEIAYTGREAHAAGAPEMGINAADAFVVAQVGIGLLRQHLPPLTRVHGIVDKGGEAPNIVPAHTSGRFMVRARTTDELEALRDRVVACFEAGATATGARLEVRPRVRYAHMEQDAEILERYRLNAEALGRRFYPFAESGLGPVSTDMGDVSLALPSIHPMIGIDSLPAVNHQPEFTDAAASPAGDRAVIDGALAMAWTAIDLTQSEPLRERLMEDERRRRA